jgi:hypothetical protein
MRAQEEREMSVNISDVMAQIKVAQDELGKKADTLRTEVADLKASWKRAQNDLAKVEADLKAITPPRKRGPKTKAEKAAKAAAEAAAPAAPAEEKPKRVLTEEHKAKMQAGRLAAKAAKEGGLALLMPPNAVAAAAQASATEEIQVAGKTYIRLSDGRCYEPGTIDGELGAWAGLFKNGVLDTTAVE